MVSVCSTMLSGSCAWALLSSVILCHQITRELGLSLVFHSFSFSCNFMASEQPHPAAIKKLMRDSGVSNSQAVFIISYLHCYLHRATQRHHTASAIHWGMFICDVSVGNGTFAVCMQAIFMHGRWAQRWAMERMLVEFIYSVVCLSLMLYVPLFLFSERLWHYPGKLVVESIGLCPFFSFAYISSIIVTMQRCLKPELRKVIVDTNNLIQEVQRAFVKDNESRSVLRKRARWEVCSFSRLFSTNRSKTCKCVFFVHVASPQVE